MRFLLVITIICVGTKEMLPSGAEATILETSGITQGSHILGSMADVINDMKLSHGKLREKLKIMIQEGKIMEKDIEIVTRNPLSQLHFMNRYTEQWNEIEQLLRHFEERKKYLNKLQESAGEQKQLAAKFLVDLVDIYDLDVGNLTLGVVKEMSSGENLSTSDCLVFAKVAHDSGMYAQCVKWTEQAVEKDVEEKPEVLDDTVNIHLNKCKQKQENLLKRHDYKKLCRRESTQGDNLAELKCYNRQHTHPRLLFEPAKVEPLSEYPGIILYHNLVPSHLLTRLTDLTIEVIRKRGGDTRRFPITASPDEEDLPAKDVVFRITQNIPNLKMDDVEDLSITSYRREFRTFFFGTQVYKPIVNDYNLLLFLSDVEHGGATVFCDSLVNVVPGKGDVLVWGTGQIMAECPVLYGKKFTARMKAKHNARLDDYTKWIDHYDFDDDDLDDDEW